MELFQWISKTIYKLTNRFDMKLFWGVIFFLPAYSAAAQDSILNKYGLHVINSVESYRESVLNKPGFEMTGLKNKIPGIKFDMRYAAGNNFLHKKLYPSPATVLIHFVLLIERWQHPF